MIVPAAIAVRFQNAEPYVRIAETQVKQAIFAFCERKGFAFQGRPKTIESLAEKLETGRFGRWTDIDDLYACAVIVPSLADEEDVLAFLGEAFHERRLVKRGSVKKDPTVFRFECTRFVGELRLHNEGQEAPDGLRRLRFEVQIRTAFEHAWQVATHSFAYKSASIDWRRLRLAAQLKAAVEQLDTLILLLDEATARVTESRWPEVDARRALFEFFSPRFADGRLPTEVEPKDWTRFCDNVLNLVKAYGPESGTVTESTAAAIGVMERALNARARVEHPRSVSLWQYVFGVLCAAGFLTPKDARYRPLITDELRALFPEVRPFKACFDLAG